MKKTILLLSLLLLLLIFGCVNPPQCGNGICESGENEYNCSIDEGGDCPTIQYHSECQNQQCVKIGGIGENGCATDNDCQINHCGNNIKESNEVCDGNDIGLETCITQGYSTGILNCSYDCLSYIISNCTNCGNGICDKNETSENCQKDCKKTEDHNFLIFNGSIENKLNILFIPLDINQTEFFTDINSMLYSKGIPTQNQGGNIYSRGLFEVEPFKSNMSKINIAIGNTLDFNYYSCKYLENYDVYSKRPILNCNWEKLKTSFSFTPYVIVIVGENFATAADKDVILMGDPKDKDSHSDASYEKNFVHEFGHAFGGLTDEYSYTFTYNCNDQNCYYVTIPDPCMRSTDPNCFTHTENEINIIPNEDVIGCPKWCKDYNKDLLFELSENCTSLNNINSCILNKEHGGCLWYYQKHPWFSSNCVPRLIYTNIGINCSCILNQSYSHQSFVQDNDQGAMMDNSIGDFNPISQLHLKTILDCCFPISNSLICKDFAQKFTLDKNNNPYFRFAYDKFSKCYKN